MHATPKGAPPQRAGADKPSDGAERPRPAPMLSIGDVARALNCPRRLVERERREGRFPRPDSRPGKAPRWRRDALVRWIAEWGAL